MSILNLTKTLRIIIPKLQMIKLRFKESKQHNPGGSDSQESACNAGDPGSISGSGRFPGEGNGYPFQYFCLENSTDRGTWWAEVHGVTRSQTQLSNTHTHTHARAHTSNINGFVQLLNENSKGSTVHEMLVWSQSFSPRQTNKAGPWLLSFFHLNLML